MKTKTMAALAVLAAMTVTVASAQQPQKQVARDMKHVQSGPRADAAYPRNVGMQGRRGDHGPARDGMRGRFDPARMFAMFDANRDGSISRVEFDRFHAKMRERRQDMHGRGPGRGGWDGAGPDHAETRPVKR